MPSWGPSRPRSGSLPPTEHAQHSIVGKDVSAASISASASMMTDALAGRTIEEARSLADQVERMLPGADVPLPDGLTPLRGVAPFAGRHGCARMPRQALREALGARDAS